MTRKGLIGCDRAIMVTAVEVGVLLTFLRVLVRRMARLDMVRKMRIRRLVRHARHRRRSIVKPAEQQDEHKQQAKGSGGHGRAPNSEWLRSEEHTSELQSLMRTSYSVFCLKKKKKREPEGSS